MRLTAEMEGMRARITALEAENAALREARAEGGAPAADAPAAAPEPAPAAAPEVEPTPQPAPEPTATATPELPATADGTADGDAAPAGGAEPTEADSPPGPAVCEQI